MSATRNNPLARYRSIGIILAGGGAKGAYQAGSLKAIHAFLNKHEALGKVRMIAGTSIGSWNAMFWLAGLISDADSKRIDLEKWWTRVSMLRLVRLGVYLPGARNYFLTARPWQKTFDLLFDSDAEIAERIKNHFDFPDSEHSVHFYFTRSNVGRAQLEVTTNHLAAKDAANLPTREWKSGMQRVDYHLARNIADLRTAVFSSMDLPPLFEYTKIGDHYYEDGGVIDNLPIRFGTEAEHCDLLFILPLNATFAAEVNRRSIVKRMLRVIDVRQGVLERNSFKMVYLYNELCALRHQIEEVEAALVRARDVLKTQAHRPEVKDLLDHIETAASAKSHSGVAEDADLADRALLRRHERVQVFAICPAPKLAINTTQFWKTKAAGRAFRLMEAATTSELNKFFAAPPDVIRMALVQPSGEVNYLEDF